MSFRFGFKTSSGHLKDVLARCLARLGKISLRHLVDVFLLTAESPGLNDVQIFISLGYAANIRCALP